MTISKHVFSYCYSPTIRFFVEYLLNPNIVFPRSNDTCSNLGFMDMLWGRKVPNPSPRGIEMRETCFKSNNENSWAYSHRVCGHISKPWKEFRHYVRAGLSKRVSHIFYNPSEPRTPLESKSFYPKLIAWTKNWENLYIPYQPDELIKQKNSQRLHFLIIWSVWRILELGNWP